MVTLAAHQVAQRRQRQLLQPLQQMLKLQSQRKLDHQVPQPKTLHLLQP
jgi:hypothetical protein